MYRKAFLYFIFPETMELGVKHGQATGPVSQIWRDELTHSYPLVI